MIGVVDYGAGNIQAILNLYSRLRISACAVRTADELRTVERIILPGVGAFDWAIDRLERSGMREALDEQVLKAKRPVLGICVGMQIMARSSEEGENRGLGWIDATVRKFPPSIAANVLFLPHMGWNDVIPKGIDPLFDAIDRPRFYFLHSYFVRVDDEEITLANSTYGITFTSAVRRGNIYGVQFHPEKSHRWGIALLQNFAEQT
jgi:glutamine amidotransferase